MKVEYKILNSGVTRGAPSFYITLKNQITNGEIADLFMYVIKEIKENNRMKNLTITGDVFHQDVNRMFLFLDQFNNAGIKTQMIVNGHRGWQAFYNKCQWLAMEIKDPDWTPIRCNELRYSWDGETTIEPLIPSNRPQLSLIPKDEKCDVFGFLRSAFNPWQVVTEFNYSIIREI